ncbi:hypothetical protein Tco_0245259, partial [Tanacetum coccineum]
WAEIEEGSLIGPELVQEMTDKVVVIKEKLKAARDRQKSYADKRRKPLEFEVILERISPIAYRLRLLKELIGVHDTFHVSNLKKCLGNANLHVPLNEIKIDKTLRFVEEPVEIMDREVKSLKRSRIALVKVRWNSKHGPEFTWEREDYMKSKYPRLFVDRADESAISAPMVAAVKLPMLNPGEFVLWKIRIERYFLMTDYALREVIVNGDSPPPKRTVDGVEQTYPPTTGKKEKKRLGGNKESKKVQKTLLKQQYENFNGKSSEGLDQIYDRLQKFIRQLEIHGETISQEDVNLKLLRKSSHLEWKTHT